MKFVNLCMVFWVVGVLFLSFNCFGGGVNQSMLVSGLEIADGSTLITRKNLKENIDHGSCSGDVSLEDYRPYDPSPSSKASVRPGPVEHGTPLMPYVPNPKPSPPHPSDNDGGSP